MEMNGDVSPASRIAALEQRYIELLEKKIDALEAANRSIESRFPLQSTQSSTTSDAQPTSDRKPSTQLDTEVMIAKTISEGGAAPTTPTVASRIRFRDRRYTAEGISEEKDALVAITQENPKSNSTPHAMTFIRHFDQQHKYAYSVIIIEDEGLASLLMYALSHHPWFSHHSQSISLTSLFEPIIHNWSLLNSLAENDKSKSVVVDLYKLPANNMLAKPDILNNAMKDLKKLLEQVRSDPGLKPYFNGGREMQDKTETITFEYLWTLFPVGELVFASVYMRQPQIFIVKKFYNKIFTTRSGMLWTLECWSYDWNGTTFNRVPVRFNFEDFKGTKSIGSLACHPLKYHRDEETTIGGLKTKLIERGRKFRKLCLMKKGHQIFEYDGFALSRGSAIRKATKVQDDESDWRSSSDSTSSPGQPKASDAEPKRQNIKNDRVMVDFGSYIQHGPPFTRFAPMGDVRYGDDGGTCQCPTCTANEALRCNQKPHYDRVNDTAEFEELQYMICPPRVLGYHLNGKRWVELDVTIVTDIQNLTDSTSFNSLELNGVQKDLIKKLVKNHASGTEKTPLMRDLMKGKGNGLVILLHGPPGVGKTLTAESVAKATGKPLFAVSVSDIGLKPAEVEHNLEVLFDLAATWRAVMLFDEADVFLESRSSNTSGLDRNALVSVLLRVLEYYDGILILTTNRIRTFDIAVQSRVNLAITYKNLDDRQKKNIYVNFIEQLTDDNAHNKEQLKHWLDEEDSVEDRPFRKLNGRQIRNVLFSAASVASGEGDGRLKLEHIKKILRETQRFQEDINNMVEMARKEAEVNYARNE